MPTRFDAYRMRDGVTPLAEDYFNPVLADIDARIAQIEDQRADLQRVIDDLTAFGLQRIDTLIGPSMAALNAALSDALAQRDALVAAVGDVGNLATQAQLTAAVQAEATARASALAAEATARASALAAEATARASALAAEAAARDAAIAQATARPTGAAYTYDSAGRIASVGETLPSGTRTTTYSYDAAGRVTQAVLTQGSTTRTTTYSYDATGTLTGWTVT